MKEYQLELGIDLCFQDFDAELESLPYPYLRLYMYVDGFTIVGCGAIKRLDDTACEIKRLFFVPSARRKGFGRESMVHLLKECRSLGFAVVKLDTLSRLIPAVALYRDLGFIETSAYNFNPEADILYFELTL